MYALFFEDTGDLIATVDRAAHAVGLGRLVSREKGRVVLGVLNDKDGATEVCWRFIHGRQVTPRSAEENIPPDASPPSLPSVPSRGKNPSH